MIGFIPIWRYPVELRRLKEMPDRPYEMIALLVAAIVLVLIFLGAVLALI